MSVSPISNHVTEALSRLVTQYRGKPFVEGLITGLVTPIQDIENGIQDLDNLRSVFTAQGVQLDGIGSIVGISRDGLSDVEYQIFILGKIGENTSNTTIKAVLHVFTILMGTTATREFELYPAQVAFQALTSLTGVSSSLYPTIASMVQMSLGAGIGLSFLAIADPANPFTCDAGGGCGSLTSGQTGGGLIGETIFNDSFV